MAIQGGGYGTLEQQQAKAGASFGTIGAKTPSTYNGFQPAQQQSTTGGTTPPQTNTQSGTLTANISNLNPKSPAPPPPIITSDKAKEDLANKQTQLTQIQQDTANHQAGLTKPPEQPLSSKTVEQPTQSSSLEGDLNSLIDNLGTNSAEITNNAQAQITPLQQQQQETQAALDAQAANALGKLNNIAKGTYPLSPAESSLLQSTTDIYKNTIAAQQTANQAYTGQMTEAMASLGISTSAPTQAMGMIHATIDEGNDRVANLNAQMAQSLSTLTLGFQKQDYDMIKSSWDETSDYLNTRLTTLQGMQKSIQDAAEQQKKDINDQTQMAMTAVMDSNTIDYQSKQDILAQAQLSETQRHDMVSEMNSRYEYTDGGVFDKQTGNLLAPQVPPGTSATAGDTGIPLLDTNTKTTSNGIPYIDGTNLTGKQASAAQLQAASLNIPYMGKTQAAALAKLDDARSNLQAVNTSLNGLLPKDAEGRVTAGPGNKLSQYFQSNDSLAAFNTWRTAAIGALQALAGGSGSGLRINQSEIAMSLANDIPQITDTVGVAQKKFDIMNTMFDNQEKSLFGSKVYDQYHPSAASTAISDYMGNASTSSSSDASTNVLNSIFNSMQPQP